MFIENNRIVSTHSHLVYDSFYKEITLSRLLDVTYPGAFHDAFVSPMSTEKMFEVMKHTNQLIYLCRALGNLYNDGTPLTPENYGRVEAAMQAAYASDPDQHHHILKDISNIRWVVLDEHRNPGDDHGREYLRPAVRLTDFMNGRGLVPDIAFSDYLDRIDRLVESHPRAVALKLSCAYDRDLCFEEPNWDAVRAERHKGLFGRACQNAVFDRICRIAEERGLPFQIHTGMGCHDNTRAICLLPMIRSHPKTRFSLLHISFPWTDDILALARDFPNVYVDLAWLPTLSVNRCARFISEAVDVIDATRLMWGDDCWTAEEAYGSLLAMDDALAMALGDRPDAQEIAERILYRNASELFRLD